MGRTASMVGRLSHGRVAGEEHSGPAVREREGPGPIAFVHVVDTSLSTPSHSPEYAPADVREFRVARLAARVLLRWLAARAMAEVAPEILTPHRRRRHEPRAPALQGPL